MSKTDKVAAIGTQLDILRTQHIYQLLTRKESTMNKAYIFEYKNGTIYFTAISKNHNRQQEKKVRDKYSNLGYYVTFSDSYKGFVKILFNWLKATDCFVTRRFKTFKDLNTFAENVLK